MDFFFLNTLHLWKFDFSLTFLHSDEKCRLTSCKGFVLVMHLDAVNLETTNFVEICSIMFMQKSIKAVFLILFIKNNACIYYTSVEWKGFGYHFMVFRGKMYNESLIYPCLLCFYLKHLKVFLRPTAFTTTIWKMRSNSTFSIVFHLI